MNSQPLEFQSADALLTAPISADSPEKTTKERSTSRSPQDAILGAIGLVALCIVWEIAPRLHWISAQFVPPFSVVVREAAGLCATGILFWHIAVSLSRVLFALGCAIAIAVPLGLVLGGALPKANRFFSPLLRLLAQINAFSLFPIFVLLLGIGESAKFAVLFWACVWPLLVSTTFGAHNTDPQLVRAARAMGCSTPQLLVKVLLPSALPTIFAGVRLGVNIGFIMLVAAEMIGAQSGLGWLVLNSTVNYLIPRLYVAAATTALVGYLFEVVVGACERKLIPWQVRS
jgi:NitT/TauT family transport system permease protein